MKTIFTIIFLGLFMFACRKSAKINPQNTTPKKDFSSLTQIVQNNLSAFNGNVGLLLMNKSGEVLYKQYYGTYNDNTFLPIASGSKITSMATVMALVEDNSLNLNIDDKVSKFFPTEFAANNKKDITLRQLMSHTSGLGGQSQWLNFNNITVTQSTIGIGQGGTFNGNTALGALMNYSPSGTKFAYGGVSMQVAGGIAEKVTGKTWDIIFKEKIADKCQMPNTNYTGLGPTTNYRIAGGAGTRMTEFGNFLLMLLNEGKFNGTQVLSNGAVKEMLKDQTNGVPLAYTPYENDVLRSSFRYGLGCFIEEITSGQPTAFGCQGAFGFSPWIDTKRGVVGILFTQSGFGKVNTQPTAQTAPYTLIRNQINKILDN